MRAVIEYKYRAWDTEKFGEEDINSDLNLFSKDGWYVSKCGQQGSLDDRYASPVSIPHMHAH